MAWIIALVSLAVLALIALKFVIGIVALACKAAVVLCLVLGVGVTARWAFTRNK